MDIKMDRATAKYIKENFWSLATEGGQLDIRVCSECGSQYLDEVGHYCGDSFILKGHDVKEGDVIEPIKIIPPSADDSRDDDAAEIFDFFKR